MLILALDTSSPLGSIAVLKDSEIIGTISTRTEEPFSSRIFRQLDFLLGELQYPLAGFDCFAVVSGPGSFTGLRVGMAAVKGWAEVYAKPIVAVSALQAVAVQADLSLPIVFPVLDARRGQVYFGAYRQVRNSATALGGYFLEGDEFVLSPEEFLSRIFELVGAGEPAKLVMPASSGIVGAVQRAAEEKSLSARISIHRASDILAPFVAHLARGRLQSGAVDNALTLDANYIRRPDAEVNLKGLSGR